MSKTIARTYDNYLDASQVVRDLEAAGIAHEDVSVVSNNSDGRHKVAEKSVGNESGPGAEIGGGVGAVAGGAGGVLAGLGMLAIPGVGPVVAAGWLVALAVGAVGGAVAGGLLGALVGSGISKEHAEIYAEAVRRGGTLITVKASDDLADRAKAIMDRHGAINADIRRGEYVKQGWTKFDPDAPAYSEDEIEAERTRYRA